MQPLECEQADADILRATRARSYRCWAGLALGAFLAAIPIVLLVVAPSHGRGVAPSTPDAGVSSSSTGDDANQPTEVVVPDAAALMAAVKETNLLLVEQLLDQGAPVDGPDAISGDTPLIAVVRKNNIDIARLLVDKYGADVYAPNAEHKCAHQLARDKKMRGLMQKQGTKQTQFVRAVTGWLKCGESNVEVLVRRGARVDWRDDEGVTALMVAVMDGSDDILAKVLAAHANVNLQERNGMSALIAATADCNRVAVRMLLAAEANLELRDNAQMTALMLAVQLGDVDTARLLVDAGADVGVTDADGTSLIDLAADEEMKTLLQKAGKSSELVV